MGRLEKKVLTLALLAGEIMMRSGSEVYRVEDTILRICKACKMDNVGVFSTTSGVFVSVSRNGDDSHSSTAIVTVKNVGIDLDKISKINSFAREFTTTDLSIEEGIEILQKLDNKKVYPIWLRLLSSAIICAFFSLIFGSNYVDASITAVIGTGIYSFNLGLDHLGTNYFLRGFLSVSVASFIYILLQFGGILTDASPSIIGTLMLFVPGIAITTAIREFISGNMLSGLTRLSEAIAIGISLAAGVGVALHILNFSGGLA